MYAVTLFWTPGECGNPWFTDCPRRAMHYLRQAMRRNYVRTYTMERAKGGRIIVEGESPALGIHVTAVMRKC